MAERTHDPTAKKLREARGKGDVARAPLVAGALGLFAALALVPTILRALLGRLAHTLNDLQPVSSLDPWSLGLSVVALVAPLAVTLIAFAVVSALATGSLTFSPSRLAPDPSRLDPFAGLRNLVDKSRIWGAARGLVVLLALVWMLGNVVYESIRWSNVAAGGPASALELAMRFARRIVVSAAVLAALVAVVDVLVGRQLWLGRLRMTRDEVMREHKEGEGDPELKRRREELHHELVAAEAVSAVRDATVLVVNPTHLACALKYAGTSGDEEAPQLTAKGDGALAARMIETARFYGIPIIRDVPVARALFELENGTEIPEALYEAVAEVLRAAWDE